MLTKIELRNKKREEAISAVQRGEEPRVVARVKAIRLNTLYEWMARYRQGGWDAIEEGHRSGRPRKLTGEVIQWLYDAITMGNPKQYQFEFCLWTLGIIRQMLIKVHGITLSKSSICRLLKQMGLSPQRPIYKAYQQDPKKVKQWLEMTYPGILSEVKKTKGSIYFCDEASFRSDHHSGTTWAKIGETPKVEEHRGRFGINCISAVNARGLMRFKCFEGMMNEETFINFLKDMVRDILYPIYLIVDGARYHWSKNLKDYVSSTQGKLKLFQLPPYSPELNPDEQVWNHAKRRTGKMSISSKEHMKNAAVKVLRSIQKSYQLISSFFKLKDTIYTAC